ncbi:hypothetical protein BZL39_I00530 [Zygosaccharomyces parabailii]|nr:hypothetical protein BZL39_I00530 [Zygosaccharomyces parabailii]CDH11730.1 related to Carboxypeptidase S [Zygosaccharomyces bailii ISA1307]
MIKLEDDYDRQERGQCFLLRHKKLLFSLGGLLALVVYGTACVTGATYDTVVGHGCRRSRCKKIEPIIPAFNKSVDMIFNDVEYKKATIERLSGAIKIPTEIGDVFPEPGEDREYFKYFFEFHDYLEKSYPLVYEQLTVEKVNELGLLYTWKGSNTSLQPILLMAHQDVVPVNRKTLDEWEHPPFSGYYDEETDYIWGRGALDCKNLLTAELEAIEQLLKDGYTPERTTLVSFGFDEESSGTKGARELGKFLDERYGKDSIYTIIDEGGGVAELEENLFLALPVNAEKGYVDVLITIDGRGGHSSKPPDHTTIGVASKLISLIEDHPFEQSFALDNPIFRALTCSAEHSSNIPSSLKRDILGAPHSRKKEHALAEFLASHVAYRDLIRTTGAVDIITGGIKANALPEVTAFLLNHRIEIHSSVNDTLEADLYHAKKIAKKYGYGLSFKGEPVIPETSLGVIEINTRYELEPAPVSPTSGPVWDLFAGTIQNVFENGVFAGNKDADMYVATYLSTGNTDTKYYWNLSKNIYRFIASQFDKETSHVVHSVGERIKADNHLSAIAFVYQYIVNAGNAE